MHPQQRAEPHPKTKYQHFTKWNAQIKQQPEWMQNLIKHVDFNRLTEVLTAVDESNHIIIVSDGSGKDFIMTFGWIMSTPEGNCVARCAGHSYGRKCYQPRFSLQWSNSTTPTKKSS